MSPSDDMSATHANKSFQVFAWASVSLTVLVGTYQVLTLGHQGLWGDEIFTVIATSPTRPLREMFDRYLLPDVHPPLHYLLMRAWQSVAPRADWAMRLPGLIAYVLTVIAAGLYPSRGIDDRQRLVFVVLIACSFGTIYFAQEVRSYYLVELFAVLTLYEVLDHAAAIQSGREPSWQRLALSAAVGLASSYNHYFGFLFFGSAVIVLAGYGLLRGRGLWRVVFLGSVVLLGFLPWLFVHAPHLDGRLGGAFWIDNSFVGIARGFLRHLVGSAIGAALIAAMCVWALWRNGRGILTAPVTWLIVALIALNGVVALTIAQHTPIITARNLTGIRVALLLLFAMMIGLLLADLRARFLIVATGFALFLSFIVTETPRASWREPIAYLMEHTTCDRREVLFYAGKGMTLEMAAYYATGTRLRLLPSEFGSGIGRELAALNPTSPGCDVVAIGLNFDPANPTELASVLANSGFRSPTFAVEEWPSAFVVRRKGSGS